MDSQYVTAIMQYTEGIGALEKYRKTWNDDFPVRLEYQPLKKQEKALKPDQMFR